MFVDEITPSDTFSSTHVRIYLTLSFTTRVYTLALLTYVVLIVPIMQLFVSPLRYS